MKNLLAEDRRMMEHVYKVRRLRRWGFRRRLNYVIKKLQRQKNG